MNMYGIEWLIPALCNGVFWLFYVSRTAEWFENDESENTTDSLPAFTKV
jgi:hypothetical protein